MFTCIRGITKAKTFGLNPISFFIRDEEAILYKYKRDI